MTSPNRPLRVRTFLHQPYFCGVCKTGSQGCFSTGTGAAQLVSPRPHRSPDSSMSSLSVPGSPLRKSLSTNSTSRASPARAVASSAVQQPGASTRALTPSASSNSTRAGSKLVVPGAAGTAVAEPECSSPVIVPPPPPATELPAAEPIVELTPETFHSFIAESADSLVVVDYYRVSFADVAVLEG